MNARISIVGWLVASAMFLTASDGVSGQTFLMDTVYAGPGYPDAIAELTYDCLPDGSTGVEINVSGAAPDQFYSIWLKLEGISPLTGIDVVPLAGVSDLAALALSTPDDKLTPTATSLGLVGDDGSGATSGPNGFFTDGNGNATSSLTLDFPLIEGGVFPFDQFDPSLSAVPLDSTPFLLNALSHTDQVGHGLFPDGGAGTAAAWFWTSQYAVPCPEPSAGLLLAISCVFGVAVRWRRNPQKT